MRAQGGLRQPAPGRREGQVGNVFVKHVTELDGNRGDEQILRIDSVYKTYQRRRGFKVSRVEAVEDVSFVLTRGRVTALVGQSGSGKSTIARLVTGVERPDTGTVTFGSVQVNRLRGRGLRDYRRHIQLVFQDPYAALNPAHPVIHNLIRPLVNYCGLNGREARKRALELLESVGLSPAERYADKHPHQLSGGQRQRIVIARALAPEPEIIIADEPISSLDVSIRAEILQLLDKLVRERQIAMLYITHDLLSARLLADEIIVLNQGRIVEYGAARDVIMHPKDAYTQLLLRSIPNPFVTAPPA
jgi:peptide/nickel transport system ATP-binding protein